MADRYASFAHTAPGKALVRRLGLPDPPRLRRHRPGDPPAAGPVLVGAAPGGRLVEGVQKVLTATGVELRDPAVEGYHNAALVFDATGIARSEQLRALYDFFHPQARALYPSGRVIVLGTPPEACADPRAATAQRALEGFVRSAGKEFGRGTTAQLVYLAPEATAEAAESTLRFLLSGRSAYVSGQVIRVGEAPADPPGAWTAIVTGASRGIGAAIAEVLARDGIRVICADVPAQGEDLAAVANAVGGTALQVDVTSDRAPAILAERRADVVVHNAGITRDRTLARMSEDEWDSVLAVNLESIERINEALVDVRRIVCISSVSGIAGNRGQANYATSKAGVIGVVEDLAPRLTGATINAVAPGFIETRMTAAMPLAMREAGRRMNSLAQGGLPVDVAETVAWLASPGSAGVNGNVVRVCGQSLVGA
jgi:3-oxoacyl-[acyl-carrier protein] reductase